MRKHKVIYFILFCVILLPTGIYSQSKKYAVNAEREESNYLHYIKPLQFKSKSQDLWVDFTILLKDTTIIKFSTTNKERYFIDSMLVKTPHKKLSITQYKKRFYKLDKKGIESRYITSISSSHNNTLFKDNNWQIILFYKGNRSIYYPTAKSQKRIEFINRDLFEY